MFRVDLKFSMNTYVISIFDNDDNVKLIEIIVKLFSLMNEV